MPMQAHEIEELLRETFPHAKITVDGDDGVHMSAMVVDESFRGMNRVQQQRAVYAALVCVEADDQTVARCLFREAYNAASERGFAYLLVGLTDQDPLLRVARRYAHVPYRSWLQASAWKPGEVGRALFPDLDGRPAYVEIAAL